MRFVPNGNRILVAPDLAEETYGGIVIPKGMSNKGYATGLVVEVGEGRMFDNGQVIPTGFQPGQRVAYLEAGQIALEGLEQPCVLLEVHRVLGRIEETQLGGARIR